MKLNGMIKFQEMVYALGQYIYIYIYIYICIVEGKSLVDRKYKVNVELNDICRFTIYVWAHNHIVKVKHYRTSSIPWVHGFITICVKGK